MMHRLMPDALVHVSAGNLNLFLLGDAVEDEVGFESMACESARGLDQLLFLFFQGLIRHPAFAVALDKFGERIAGFVLQKVWR
jgi:hypothetical protein